MMSSLPKVSKSIRMDTDLEYKFHGSLVRNDLRSLPKNEVNDISWKTLSKLTLSRCNQSSDAKNIFSDFWVLVRDLYGGFDDHKIIDNIAINTLCLLLNANVGMEKHKRHLNLLFGNPITTATYNLLLETAKKIGFLLDSTFNHYKNMNEALNPNYWGGKIEILNFCSKSPDMSKIYDLRPNLAVGKKNIATFSLKYEKGVCGSISIKQWLQSYVNESIADNIIQLIQSSKTNEDIENDLFEILEFKNIELIERILSERKKIVESIKLNNIKDKRSIFKKRTVPKSVDRPIITSVTVQSEFEKELIKQSRRDEKKLNRLLNSTENDAGHKTNKISPVELRIHQQHRLLAFAQRQSILSGGKMKEKSEPVIYPYIFDNQSTVKSHIGFISGNQILLPHDFQRTDCKEFEEIKIPLSETAPLNVGNNRIQIENLDDIAKLVFQKTKELNRIQSIVFPVAYNSNENLLICAPTGAGKTNVALLTIVRIIRLHMNQGVINREQFKIVYIAPMKALASEMVGNFADRLKCLNISVRELTGDMQLSKSEMQDTQVLVTTPEKWDVVTRKGVGDVSILSLVKLLIIDEVHLLHGDRGPVIEALVARTLRLVESSQSMIRIVGLSATLPNYMDVAKFLRVNPLRGLFYFDSRFRPVPLQLNFVGIKSRKALQQLTDMDKVCYDKCLQMVQNGHQVMVFVHARNATVRVANIIKEFAQQQNHTAMFLPENTEGYSLALKRVLKIGNKQLSDLFEFGLAVHNAGMLRTYRNLIEEYFLKGYVKVLVCTSTLAWGVNLPAHAVIIRGTDVYDSKKGSFTDLGILDVLQIFGRAGRPQFDKSGVGTILTSHDKLSHYLTLLTNQFPIESNFIQCLADNMNAEISLGSICNVSEAIEWLSYTYLFVRMRVNPHVYGIEYSEVEKDPSLVSRRRHLILTAALTLDKAKMIRFNPLTEEMNITDLGRTASHFYIKYDTVEIFNNCLKPFMNESEIFSMISQSQEFQQLKVREDELDELDYLRTHYCKIRCEGGSENVHGKVNILMQTYLGRGFVKSYSLVSDMAYIIQNVVRISRALFTIVLRNNNAILTGRILTICKMFEKQMWDYETPLRQFPGLSTDILNKLEIRGLSIYALKEMRALELRDLLRNSRYVECVSKCANELPFLEISADFQPITRTVLKVRIRVDSDFRWNDKIHGKHSQNFWIWIEDSESNFIYHSEYFQLPKKNVIQNKELELFITVPIKEPLPSQYYLRCISDNWLGNSTWIPLNLKHLIFPEFHSPLTDLLPLQPLPIKCLKNRIYESLYNFEHFNPIQTQVFHCLYHTDNNVLLGAPTGSGKTISAEIAIFRIFQNSPRSKVVYIAPLKALVKERINDWNVKFGEKLGKHVVELTGDVTPDISAIQKSHIIVTTPEKWDSVSRSWQTRKYVCDVALIIIDEIHLLGEERGPVLEVIISRVNFIKSHTGKNIRIVGLSTALSNADDLANWIGISKNGLYNFKPSVRPVPLTVHINGFPGKHYCPRMATMNRPTYQAIRSYASSTSSLVFVSSRRQTRLTALDLVTFLAAEDNPKQFLHLCEDDLSQILTSVSDVNLKFVLSFGIGIHHAGLQERDRKIVEELFYNRKIQVLIATSTLAWGVNLPAHLVVIKGTEYFDGKLKKYVDMPITDILQMMGRAGRPQFDNEGIAVVLVHDAKKFFYKKFLYDPFPVESNLLQVLPDHVNAEIVSRTVQTKQSVLDYLTWTFFFRRLQKNPSFYHLDNLQSDNINLFLSTLIDQLLNSLESAACIIIQDGILYPTSVGRIASYYYLSHQTMSHFCNTIKSDMYHEDILKVLCYSFEFDQQPVRHNEDFLNAELAKQCRYKVDHLSFDSPYTKTYLLMQAYLSRLELPNTDYSTDTKSVLDQSIRVLQAIIDFSAENGWLATCLQTQQLLQCIIQGRWFDDHDLMMLPYVNENNVSVFNKVKHNRIQLTIPVLKDVIDLNQDMVVQSLENLFTENELAQIFKVLDRIPDISVQLEIGRNQDSFEKIATNSGEWIKVFAEEECTLTVILFRKKQSEQVYCPKFPKGKTEGWFLTLGSQGIPELLAIRRISWRGTKYSTQLNFKAPTKFGRHICTLYLFSDCYLGLDQQYEIKLDVTVPEK